MRLLVVTLVGLGACRKNLYVPPVPTAVPDDVPIPRESGPVAGPRAVVDQAPPPAVAADTPGGGPLPPWLARLRAEVNARLDGCLATGPATIKTGTALVQARIGGQGAVLEATLLRSSGSESYDDCLVQALLAARPSPPPPEALAADGQLVTELAFR